MQCNAYLFLIFQKVKVVVLSKNRTSLEVSILPEEVRAVLPTVHLSDHVSNGPILWESIEEGDTVSVTCLSKNKQQMVSFYLSSVTVGFSSVVHTSWWICCRCDAAAKLLSGTCLHT